MSTGNWMNSDGLYLEFGTTKATVENWGDYVMYGGLRVIEGFIDVSTISTAGASTILSQTTFFPPAGKSSGANSNTWIIEKVEVICEAVIANFTSLSVGLVQEDRTTTPSNYDHALVNAETALTGVGEIQTYVAASSTPTGSSNGGTLIGTTPAASTGPYYITAKANSGGTTQTGKFRVRIYYRGTGTITQ